MNEYLIGTNCNGSVDSCYKLTCEHELVIYLVIYNQRDVELYICTFVKSHVDLI